jgi:2-(1,2-epoxy-1,2-dihydrophenyl)acetyl-CoA isomerase
MKLPVLDALSHRSHLFPGGTSVSDSPEVVIEVRDAVGWITLNRPERLNLMTRTLLEALLEALEQVAEDDGILAVALTGAGRAFSAGGDLSVGLDEITGSGSIARQTSELRRFMRTSQLLVEMPKPTIAVVNGACAGGSLGLACAADIRVASDRAVFATAFLTAGVSGDFGGTWGLSRAVGPGIARELYLTGRRLDAEAALRLGLVSHLFPADELIEKAHLLAVDLTRKPPLAVQAMKENFNALPASLAQILELEAARHVRCTNTDDATEARLAFIEKRSPVFHAM